MNRSAYKTVSIYDRNTGLFVGQTFTGEPEHVALNVASTPPHFAAIDGLHDHKSAKVDLTSGAVVDYQPPRPSPDHEWNTDTKRWQLTAAAAAKGAARELARAQIAQLEAKQHRAVREAILGDQDAVKRLQAVDDQIKALRQQLT